MTTHVCLAVEISTPADPIVAPSLLGRAPGWPTTDLAVLYDNNKAQRNIDPVAGGTVGTITDYALVHNAATRRRDMILAISGERSELRPRIRVIGGAGKVARNQVVLSDMEPGESRWLSFQISDALRKNGATVVVEELVDGAIVNGFAVEGRMIPDGDFARDTARYHATIMWRIGRAFDNDELAQHAEEVIKLLEGEADHQGILAGSRQHLRRAVELLVGGWDGGDPFKLRGQVRKLAQMKPGPEATALHASILNGLDSFATMRLTTDGDVSDILQTVDWTVRLLREEGLSDRESAAVISACERFAGTFGQRRGRGETYVALMREILAPLARVAGKAGIDESIVEDVRSELGNPSRLQGAHRRLLLSLGDAIGAP